jgi:Zn-dependent protease with chaperone function
VISRPSLQGRAALAIALLVGFYLLALGMVAILLYIPFAADSYAHALTGRIGIFCIGGAFAIVRGIFPRRDRFEPPGPTISESEQPRLFATIREVAAATNQAMPAEVYFVPEVNAFVAQRGGLMGVGSRRVMGIGLPLLDSLTVGQFRAVIAHEFGHYYGGDTKLGPWVYKTRAAIIRTLESLGRHSGGFLQKPFVWYGTGFLATDVSHLAPTGIRR